MYWCSVAYEVFPGKEFMLSSMKFKILRFGPLVKEGCEAAGNGDQSFKTLGTEKLTEKK